MGIVTQQTFPDYQRQRRRGGERESRVGAAAVAPAACALERISIPALRTRNSSEGCLLEKRRCQIKSIECEEFLQGQGKFDTQEEHHVTTEAEIRVILPQAEGCRGLPITSRSQEKVFGNQTDGFEGIRSFLKKEASSTDSMRHLHAWRDSAVLVTSPVSAQDIHWMREGLSIKRQRSPHRHVRAEGEDVCIGFRTTLGTWTSEAFNTLVYIV
ncbi:uncharacterized protein [Vicugna pacos]|uniref:Uncharacterized protein isoform X1 n=1 Tax=Vicugna pacos TaxID=30538 RepID=A0ABM5D1S9_VICPA